MQLFDGQQKLLGFNRNYNGTDALLDVTLPDTDGFAAASKHVSPETVAQLVTCGPSAEHHLQAINRYVQAGYEHIILVQIGPEQDAFFDFFERDLAPALRKAT